MKALVLDYLLSSVEQALYWAEACLDPEDDCPAFRDQVRSILRDASQIAKSSPYCPLAIANAIHEALSWSFYDMHKVNEHLQQAKELLQVEIVKEGMKDAAKAEATTTIGR